MSTRAMIHFSEGSRIDARIFQHADGYPESEMGVIASLARFFATQEKHTGDTRFNDPSMLAARFVVWLAGEIRRDTRPRDWDPKAGMFKPGKARKALDFLGVRILATDAGDVEFVYRVDCAKLDSKGRPTVTYRTARRAGL